jgi:mannose-6-phosphate isomerase-like protein (cupin superfamily)
MFARKRYGHPGRRGRPQFAEMGEIRLSARRILVWLGMCAWLAPIAGGQITGDQIDLYFGDWHGSPPRSIRGSLEERDIFTRGDAEHPTKKAALLRYLNSYTYATLAPGAATTATRLQGEQEIYFIASGQGTMKAGEQIADLYRNIAVLVPAELEFSLKSTGSEALTMYVINEPTPAGFQPNTSLLIKDENKIPVASVDGLWCHIVKPLFATSDGLGTLQSVLTVTYDPLTISKPHVVDHTDIEEVFTALEGRSLAWVSNALRWQTPGMAFYHVPDNLTPHANINQDKDAQAKFLYFGRYHPHETRK